MAESPTVTITILDLPEILDIVHEAIDAVPGWERAQFLDRLNAVIARAKEIRRG